MKYLGVTPGSVSPFGLINDAERHVRVFLDRDLKSAARVSFHPNINTATWVIAYGDFERFLSSTGHVARYVSVSVQRSEVRERSRREEGGEGRGR
jgi:Ala-tRNA(Pro) deacylase